MICLRTECTLRLLLLSFVQLLFFSGVCGMNSLASAVYRVFDLVELSFCITGRNGVTQEIRFSINEGREGLEIWVLVFFLHLSCSLSVPT